jgi:hypothetical protein
MADRKPFLLRVDPRLLEQLQRWANDDLRSLNAQIEFLLRKSLADARRGNAEPRDPASPGDRPSADDSPDPTT